MMSQLGFAAAAADTTTLLPGALVQPDMQSIVLSAARQRVDISGDLEVESAYRKRMWKQQQNSR